MPTDSTIVADGDEIDVGNPIENQTIFANGELVDDGGQSNTIFLNDRGIGQGVEPGAIVGDGTTVRIIGSADPFATFDTYTHSDSVQDVAWSGLTVGQEFAASCRTDGTIKVYSAAQGTVVHNLDPVGGSQTSRSVSFGGGLLFSGWDDNTVYVHDATSDFQLVDTLQKATDQVNTVAANDDWVIYGDRNGQIHIHTVPDRSFSQSIDAASNCLDSDISDNYYSVSGLNGNAYVYDIPGFTEVANPTTNTSINIVPQTSHSDSYHGIADDFNTKLRLFATGTTSEQSISRQHSTTAIAINSDYVAYGNGSNLSIHDAASGFGLITTRSIGAADAMEWRTMA